MARLGYGGFEGGSLSFDSFVAPLTPVLTGSPVLEATIVRTGAGSLKIAPSSGVAQHWDSGSTIAATDRLRVYVRVTARPASTARAIIGSAATINIRLNPNGTLEAFISGAGGSIGTSATALTDTTRWYRIEIDATVTTGGIYIDGVKEINASGVTAFAARVLFGSSDTVADTYTAYYDDWAVDSAGLPGAGACALLLPTADSSVGGSWTLGTGTAMASNGFGSVDNAPPVGVADLAVGSDPKQIRNAGANTNYVATIAAYTTQLGAADTVNATYGIAWVGAPVSTGAKTGALQITANPAQGSATAFQNNSGQYWTGSAAGTWPTNWKRVRTAIDAAPSVTLATNPTLSLQISGGTTSRIAMCCSLGIYVDYTPAVVTQVPYRSPYPQLLAH